MAKKAKTTATESGASWFSLDVLLKIVGALVAVGGLVFGIYQFRLQRLEKEGQKQETAAAQKREQKSLYYGQAISAASGFAQASTKEQAEEKKKEFWTLYYGALSVVEDDNVKHAMQNFGGAVQQWEKYNKPGSDFSAPSIFELEDKEGKPQTFEQLAYELTQACRESLEK